MADFKEHFEDKTVSPAEDVSFPSRRLPGIPSGEARGMLPGMAVIGIYMLIVAMLNAFAAMRNTFGTGEAKYCILAVCTFIVIGVFGMLRLLRWGWALVTAGCLLMAGGFFYGFHRTHIPPYIVQGLFALCFFLYLIRPETRARLR